MSQTWENAQARGIAKMGTRATAVIAAANKQAATQVVVAGYPRPKHHG